MGMNTIVFLATGEQMKTALLNTLMGFTIVFLVLLLISYIISLFKYISKAEQRHMNKEVADSTKTDDSTREAVLLEPEVIEETTEELVDDAELVAVITAAIYAYEESYSKQVIVPADGLVVRSIKKSNKSKWQNA